jgi:predicted MPP superfamily phosphohydrolase
VSSAALRWLAAGAVAGTGVLAYAAGYEVHDFRLRRADVPVLPPGSPPITVLHVSDLHLTPWQHAKQRWLEALSWLRPDLVVATGDLIAHREAVPALQSALAGVLTRPGVFVHGSNDYFAPVVKNPLRYLLPDDGSRNVDGRRLPTDRLDAALLRAGWLNLDNARGDLVLNGVRVHLVGTDDAHLGYDDYARVAGLPPLDADLVMGVTHAPYLRVLDAMAADGVQLVLAGHTHGGQVCLPGGRALVTNCDLEPERARGLSRHPASGGPGAAWLHVSGGLGTSPTAPVRLACRPEATVLTLLPRPAQA